MRNEDRRDQGEQHHRPRPQKTDGRDRRRPRSQNAFRSFERPQNQGAEAKQAQQAPGEPGREQVAPLAATPGQDQARQTPTATVTSATEEIRGSARLFAGASDRHGIHEHDQQPKPDRGRRTASGGADKRADAARAACSTASPGSGSPKPPSRAPGSAASSGSAGRSISHLDPPRAAVALDDDQSTQQSVDRLRKLELDRNLGLVDRLERPAVLPGRAA